MVKTKIKKMESEIETILKDLLDRLQVTSTIEVTETEPDNYKVNVQTEETGLLIGYHGETINSIQLILGVMLYKKLGKWIRVVLDVGDYRKMREDSIKEMVNRIVAEVEASGQPVNLPFLTPLERRIVHMMLADHPKVSSQSQGEGRDRRVMIKLREAVPAEK